MTRPPVSRAYLDSLSASGERKAKCACVHCGPSRRRPFEPIVRVWQDMGGVGSRCFRCDRREWSGVEAMPSWLWRPDVGRQLVARTV